MPALPGLSLDDLVVRRLAGPPETGFDCGREEQTAFLYERAWEDQQALLSVTYLYHLNGILAAYATICMDAIALGRRERGVAVRYQEVTALKLAQLGVHRTFQGRGIGRLVVADTIAVGARLATRVGCRYVTLDAQPDLVTWYEGQGFRRNQLRQDQRARDAVLHQRNPEKIAVSMRFDLREG
ncbi:MAG TPA: GNAT family N-acetyltransferase [Longimicrobium sp.]|jgi:ribosomal protein S18 acetylase RimI-like enzyme